MSGQMTIADHPKVRVDSYTHPDLVSSRRGKVMFRPEGYQRFFRFKNGYGASVISHSGSYGGDGGLFELAVIVYTGTSDDSWGLCYTTDITDDVIGYLDAPTVASYLNRIAALPYNAEALAGATMD